MMQQQPDKQLLTWPLVQQFFSRAPLSTTNPSAQELFDARLINAYGEKIPNSKDEFWVVKRPGVGPLSYNPVPGRSGGTYAYGIPNSDGTTLLLSILNGQLYANGVGVTGFVATPGEPCYFETINSNPVTVIILPSAASGAQGGYVYTPSTGHIANMVDTTFIAINRVPGLAFLNDWLYVMDVTGTIWNTQNQSDAFIWSGLNTIQANNYGDMGVCLTRQLTYVIAMKQWTTNIFYDAGAQVKVRL